MELNNKLNKKMEQKTKFTNTELRIISGIVPEHEAYCAGFHQGEYDFITLSFQMQGYKHLTIELLREGNEIAGKFDFTLDQAYFLKSWLETLLDSKREGDTSY